MRLLTQEIINTLPKTYEQDGKGNDAIAYVRLYLPNSYWNWYITEYNKEDGTCFGLVQGHEEELGYFNIHDLEMLKLNNGLQVQRDLKFTPTTIQEIKEKHPTK